METFTLDPSSYIIILAHVRICSHHHLLPPPCLCVMQMCRFIAFAVVLMLANLGPTSGQPWANLGTSFASAILAKDTTTHNGQLSNKKTNEAVATAAAVEKFTVGEEDGKNVRKLMECSSTSTTADFRLLANCAFLALPRNSSLKK